jgi:hypothetical protein
MAIAVVMRLNPSFLVPARQVEQGADDLAPEALPLGTGKDGDVAEVGARPAAWGLLLIARMKLL